MKLVLSLVVLLGVFFVVQSQDTNPIDWITVVPVERVPGFFDRFPWLRLIFTLFSSNELLSSGSDAAPYRFTWTAGIVVHQNEGSAFCGGSILSNDTILTSCHCLMDAASGIVIVGGSEIQNASEPGQRRIFFERSDIILHPMCFRDSLDNDIALIKLPSEIEFSDTISSVRLPNIRQVNSDFQNQETTLAGWGRSLFDFSNTQLRPSLKYVEGTVLSHIRCYANFPTMVSRNQMCTVSDNFMGACPGDLGGGFTITEADGVPTLIAVVNFWSAVGCEAGRSTVSTRTAPHIVWIEREGGIPVRPDF